MAGAHIRESLNSAQRTAVEHGHDPLLIVAGAGTGKTNTLIHRVVYLVEQGIPPERILLLTFTRRAAGEMLRRADALMRKLSLAGGPSQPALQRLWGGTFHSIATRFIRMYGPEIGLTEDFTIHDRSDSEDLMDVVRTAAGFAKMTKRFPKKGTCVAIYSHCVNSRKPIDAVLADHFPWCGDFVPQLKELFQKYVDRKQDAAILDYDDLLLYWQTLLEEPSTRDKLRARFDCVLVDEYQDTNLLQAEILRGLRPDGRGLTAVGDDAQAIYSFRAASIQNILEFPQHFPGTTLVKLEQNYRSTQPILKATNAVIRQAKGRYEKDLWTTRTAGDAPQLALCQDESDQADFLVRRILEHREAGIDLRKQAVLFRASHHSIVLEAELARHNIPFVKYGGLRFIETAHIKDLIALLRLAENPRDVVSGMRVLGLLPGVGPKKSHQLLDVLANRNFDFHSWQEAAIPDASREHWPRLVALLLKLVELRQANVAAQVHAAVQFYSPLLAELHDNAEARQRDLEQLEQIASRYGDRHSLLAELTLDPPSTTEDFASDPSIDEDYLILSTIHSAKGLEWDAVYVIHASDGNIPADMATKDPAQIDEERRLFYVALTRAKRWLTVCCPQRYYQTPPGSMSDRHGFAQLTRFLAGEARSCFQGIVSSQVEVVHPGTAQTNPSSAHHRVRDKLRSMWQ